MSALSDRIRRAGPKKILACDGGGILGLMSVEILAKIETDLRAQANKPNLVLADYFDFVCGTSTGAIIAACISSGMDMATIRQFYIDNGKEMFDPAGLLNRIRFKYDDGPLAKQLRDALGKQLGGDPTLGSPGLRNLLMMVLRNASTDSPWPVSNNPFAKYNDRSRDDCNLKLPLWQLVRASTAAPTFFPPEVVTIGEKAKKTFVFVDGGVTTYNNPAFLAYLMVTASPYNLNWKGGESNLLIVSIGTGKAAKENQGLKASDMNLLYNAANIPGALMNAALDGHDLACRTIGRCRFGGEIDREVGHLVPANDPTPPRQFSYVRYDPLVNQKGLADLGLSRIKPEHVQELDSIEHIDEIQQVGRAYAAKYVESGHRAGFAP